jgi:hypothetical protein
VNPPIMEIIQLSDHRNAREIRVAGNRAALRPHPGTPPIFAHGGVFRCQVMRRIDFRRKTLTGLGAMPVPPQLGHG